MDTKVVVESLLYNVKNYDHIRRALKVCRVLNNNDRNWSAKQHQEINHFTSKFEEPVFICLINTIITVFIISQKKKNRVYPVIQINGPNTQLRNLSKTKIISEILYFSKIKDFLPQNISNQIYWIPYQQQENITLTPNEVELSALSKIKNGNEFNEEIEMVIFSEYLNGLWFIEKGIHRAYIKNTLKTNPRQIIKNILTEF